MTRLEKIIEAVHPGTRVENIQRLNGGDLSHIGDAIDAGEKNIMVTGRNRPVSACSFDGLSGHYKRIKSTYTLAGVEVPRPLIDEPDYDEEVWLAGVRISGEPICTSHDWSGVEWQQQALEVGLVYKNEEDSKILSTALSKLIKNAIKEALADS